jgi:anti-sigma regulatory factor (Ser/Thr protein kinase)
VAGQLERSTRQAVTSATFPSESPSIAGARRFVTGALGEVPGPVGADIALMVSELVTNAIRHAGTDFRVTVDRTPAAVRVSVTDGAPGRPVALDPGPQDLSGRGLMIVDRLADAWGVDPARPGKTVWFSIALGA